MAVHFAADILIAALAAYAVFGGADFGAGFWDLTAGNARRGARLRGLVYRSMSPVWEANHVWLIVVLVVTWTCFPRAFGPVMETLYVPLFLAAVGIVLRGAAHAVRGEAATIAEARMLGALFAISSVLTPFFFGCAIGAIASGRVPADGSASAAFSTWTGLTALWIGTLAVVLSAYLAAVFLGADSIRAQAADLAAAFRRRALGAAAVAGAMAIAGLFVIRIDAPRLYEGLTSDGGLAMVVLSTAVGVVTLWLVWKGRFEVARYTSGIAVGVVIAGWALAQRPNFLPGQLTLAEAAADDATVLATLIVLVLALIAIVPSLAVLFRLTLQGRLSDQLHPIAGTEDDR